MMTAQPHSLNTVFNFDALSWVMISLVLFLGLSILGYSLRYFKYEGRQLRFFSLLSLLIISTITMVSANHILILFLANGFSNMTLAYLMVHNSNWEAGRQSGILAAKNFFWVSLWLGIALICIYQISGTPFISEIIQDSTHHHPSYLFLICLLISAMAQSAIIPFHRWVLSSLNSPTPVSALMHAGIINGGGFLIARFAPLYLDSPSILLILFYFGLATALLGTLLKLIQNDLKRMLACSTIGQMGFMFVQCGLGLFPNAIAHLCLHGMFKAYLFLGHASLALDKGPHTPHPKNFGIFVLALFFGLLGSLCFAYANHTQWLSAHTPLVQNIVACLFCTQIALSLFPLSQSKLKLPVLGATVILGYIYGSITHLFEWLLSSMHIMAPQPLNLSHVIGIALLILPWSVLLFWQFLPSSMKHALKHLYIYLLNHSQPHPKTITTIRNDYQFK